MGHKGILTVDDFVSNGQIVNFSCAESKALITVYNFPFTSKHCRPLYVMKVNQLRHVNQPSNLTHLGQPK